MSSPSPAPFVPPIWPATVFYLSSILILPLYFFVFISLFSLRYVSKTYNTTFYTILLQHCIADLFAMCFYFVIIVARGITFIRELYFEYQEFYIAAAAYNHIYYTLYIRCSGIVLLSFQRFLVIKYTHTKITTKVQSAPKWAIIGVYWVVPTLISLVVLKDTNFKYESFETMAVIAEQEVIQRNTLMALIIVSLTCILCSVAYGALYIFVRKNSVRLSKYDPGFRLTFQKTISRSLRREISLAIQVFILLLAFFAILVYYSFQNYFAQTHNTGPIFYMRGIYPMANGFLSYMNPFCILFLNNDLTKQVIRSLTCKKFKLSDAQVSGIISNSSKQQQRKGINQVTFLRKVVY
ncbi:Protein CBR-SRV-25 [Caenorhabditis briggsae]|uniref:Protein CBR-SRV-25 n=1 Tax=Caenorhabditis briggsae TaxID=6238 RepID=A8WZY8_CAEBR|nr:Protein CBR-SRV-25 [Caenorhabditis briggsae]CAP25948.2 Protein CBR-SRV-25 [Caenorhabditis briggsae]